MKSIAREMLDKSVIAVILVLSAWGSVSAQFQGAEPVHQEGRVCGRELISGFSFSSNNEASQALSKVIRAAGLLPDRFVILAADVDNAFACEDHASSIRYILFNPSWIRGLSLGNSENTDWMRLGILAHEVGHHALNHYLIGRNSTPQIELEADEYAGKILAILGATLEQAQSAFRQPAMCSKEGGGDHPKCADRLAAVARGWRKGHPYPNAVRKFFFRYNFDTPPSNHFWTKIDDTTWAETYSNSGDEAEIEEVGRITVDGDEGILLRHKKLTYLEYFIPDKGSKTMYLRDRANGGPWLFLGEMKGIQ